MLTDANTRRSPAKFALRFVGYSLALFGALRLGWVETQLLTPFVNAQGALAAGVFGTSSAPVIATLACSGADAIAFFLGAVFAYPARWRARAGGALIGLGLIIAVNIIRIGTLGQAAGSAWFDPLHLYIWPTILTVLIGAILFVWTQRADAADRTTPPAGGATRWLPESRAARVFVAWTMALMAVFIASAPLYLESQAVLQLATFMARVAAAVLVAIGIAATHQANVLFTPHGALLVTQECITTPLIPVYIAAVTAFGRDWRWKAAGYAATVPIFVALGIARLLVIALPSALVASPLVLIHAFYQLALGAVLVLVCALWRHGRSSALAPTVTGLTVGTIFMWTLGAPYAHLLTSLTGMPADDPQAAIFMLPGFQTGLYLALALAASHRADLTRRAVGLGALVITQVVTLLALQALSASGIAPDVRDIRAWAVVAPLVIVLLTRPPAIALPHAVHAPSHS